MSQDDTRITVRLNTAEWLAFYEFKTITATEDNSKAVKLALNIATNVIKQLTGGLWAVEFKRVGLATHEKIAKQMAKMSRNSRLEV